MQHFQEKNKNERRSFFFSEKSFRMEGEGETGSAVQALDNKLCTTSDGSSDDEKPPTAFTTGSPGLAERGLSLPQLR